MERNITPLPDYFEGIGEVKGSKFYRVDSSRSFYIYEVHTLRDNLQLSIHYELILRDAVPVCIDFKNRIYSETEFKEVYPKSNGFGRYAWTFRSLALARIKMGRRQELIDEMEVNKTERPT